MDKKFNNQIEQANFIKSKFSTYLRSTFKINDEVNSLIKSVEDMRIEINTKEEYKTNMYQSLSHELKTPIAVITSYVEAASDKVIPYEDAIKLEQLIKGSGLVTYDECTHYAYLERLSQTISVLKSFVGEE